MDQVAGALEAAVRPVEGTRPAVVAEWPLVAVALQAARATAAEVAAPAVVEVADIINLPLRAS